MTGRFLAALALVALAGCAGAPTGDVQSALAPESPPARDESPCGLLANARRATFATAPRCIQVASRRD